MASAVLAIVYDIGQVLEWLGALGSKGGPASMSTPLGLAVLLTPSLLLGPAFVLSLVALHRCTRASDQVWSQAALTFGTIYTTLISGVYFVQLALIAPRMARGDLRGVEPFVFVPFDSYLYAIDILGYSSMSVATLFAGIAVRAAPRARALLLANGALVPFLLLQMSWRSLIWPASLWAVIFPAGMIALALHFRRMREA